MARGTLQSTSDRNYGLEIALVEDDGELRDRILIPRLRDYGFEVRPLANAGELQDLLAKCVPDVVVLDIALPDGDGFAIARGLRERFPMIGLVILTARGLTRDRVRGLSHGADAYLSKPVEISLLAATLHSVCRRLAVQPIVRKGRSWSLSAEGWCVVSPAAKTIALSRTERKLMLRLFEKANQLVPREALIEALTDNAFDFDPHRLDSLVHRLRKKVKKDADEELPLHSVHGVGYVLACDPTG